MDVQQKNKTSTLPSLPRVLPSCRCLTWRAPKNAFLSRYREEIALGLTFGTFLAFPSTDFPLQFQLFHPEVFPSHLEAGNPGIAAARGWEAVTEGWGRHLLHTTLGAVGPPARSWWCHLVITGGVRKLLRPFSSAVLVCGTFIFWFWGTLLSGLLWGWADARLCLRVPGSERAGLWDSGSHLGAARSP